MALQESPWSSLFRRVPVSIIMLKSLAYEQLAVHRFEGAVIMPCPTGRLKLVVWGPVTRKVENLSAGC